MDNDIKYIIETIKNNKENYTLNHFYLIEEIENLQAQNERYRVALEDIYIEDKDSKAAKIAQQALTGE